MGHHEMIWLDNYKGPSVIFYHRYVDDTFRNKQINEQRTERKENIEKETERKPTIENDNCAVIKKTLYVVRIFQKETTVREICVRNLHLFFWVKVPLNEFGTVLSRKKKKTHTQQQHQF